MCNCGNKRDEYKLQSYSLSNSPVSPIVKTKKIRPDIKFQYTGLTALTVIGSITGKKYRFAQSNEIQAIDYRDASSMIGISVLKKTI